MDIWWIWLVCCIVHFFTAAFVGLLVYYLTYRTLAWWGASCLTCSFLPSVLGVFFAVVSHGLLDHFTDL